MLDYDVFEWNEDVLAGIEYINQVIQLKKFLLFFQKGKRSTHFFIIRAVKILWVEVLDGDLDCVLKVEEMAVFIRVGFSQPVAAVVKAGPKWKEALASQEVIVIDVADNLLSDILYRDFVESAPPNKAILISIKDFMLKSALT